MNVIKSAPRRAVSLTLLALFGSSFFPNQALAQLINLSSRGFVGTGDNVMIAGFIIGGSTPTPVLVRGRGPSLGGAPFFLPGTLADPFLRVFSGQAVIAQNDNWQDTQQQEILAAGLEPCEPNPGQLTSPPGCTSESALVVTLPPGNYTAILSGIGGGSGTGLVEVFELTGATSPPNILGTYSGSSSLTQSNCQNPLNNGTVGSVVTIMMSAQTGSLFSGSASSTTGGDTVNATFFGTVTGGGTLAGSFSTVAVPSGFQSSGTFNGSLIGNVITINFSGQITVGETCTGNGSYSASR